MVVVFDIGPVYAGSENIANGKYKSAIYRFLMLYMLIYIMLSLYQIYPYLDIALSSSLNNSGH